MGKTWTKFLLLMWKNWKLQYRRPLQTAVEIIAPVIFSILLVILRSLVDPKDFPPRVYTPFQPLSIDGVSQGVKSTGAQKANYTLVYSPSPCKFLDTSLNILKFAFNNVKGYKDSKALEAHFITAETVHTFAGLEFDDALLGKDDLPHDIVVSLRFPGELRSIRSQVFGLPDVKSSTQKASDKSVVDTLNQVFKIRDWKTNLLYPLLQLPGPRDPDMNNGSLPGYYKEGFLALQVVITHLLAVQRLSSNQTLLQKKHKLPTILMQRFPYSGWRSDPLLPALISFSGMLIMLSFVYSCINTVKVIAIEKERQLKEAMKIMGLPNYLHWTAWFIKTFLFLLIAIIIIIVLLKVSWYPRTDYSVFTFSNSTVMFFFLLLYICAVITFCFAVSVFFSEANTAATVAGLVWFLTYAPFLFFQLQYEELSLSTKLIASLGLNTAMSYGCQILLMFEGSGEGIQWNNIWEPNTPDDNLTLGLIMMMLIIDTFLYLFIALYVEAIFPGQFGTAQPWYFPVTKTYWLGSSRKFVVEDSTDNNTNNNEFFEKDPDLKPGIQIMNLRKAFGKKVAVKNLSLSMYNGQITVLLGHNGAGKTTTISMLTGIIPPTSGTALINDYDIRKSMNNIRSSLGLCPQHNILFDDLTVNEHLYFFSKLKGLSGFEVHDEILKYVELLELLPKLHNRSSTLSGGMKRRLCIGIALCGNSKIVLLDEPTAGMDPSSRRALWDLLLTQKQERCILLSTHYMDEADILGDRIAIMSNGELRCCGSSFFLKRKYGSGYRLILVKAPTCDSSRVTAFLENHIQNIQINTNVGSELSYILPEDQVGKFEILFRDLEENTKDLGIQSYGISLNSLDEVFHRVLADATPETKTPTTKLPQQSRQNESISRNVKFVSGSKLILNQFLAMLMKRFLSIIRTWILQLIQIIIPVAFLIISIVVSRNMAHRKYGDLPKLLFTLESYRDPRILIESDVNNEYAKLYLDILKGYHIRKVKNISSTILELTKKSPVEVRKSYVVAALFRALPNNSSLIIAWFNNDLYHTAPLALGLVLDTVYKKLLGKQFSIRFANHPLPFSSETKIERLLKGNSKGFQLAFNIGFSMAFVASLYVLFYVRERVSKSKHLQFVSGVKGYVFWIASFLCDLVTFIITIIVIIITLLCFHEEGYTSPSDIGRIFLILFYFGFAVLPMVYVASYFFDIPSTGYTRLTLLFVFTGVAAFLVIQILSTPELLLTDVADVLHWIFLIVPHYALATGIRDSFTSFATNKMCNFFVSNCMEYQRNMSRDQCWYLACHNNYSGALTTFCCEREQDYFKWENPGIGRNILYTFSSGIIVFIILILMEHKIFSKMTQKICKYRATKTDQKILREDDDVITEMKKVHNTAEKELIRNNAVVFKDLTKNYKSFLAVNKLCLTIQQYECFGLLGVNGAGKTTTFMMLTGDLEITHGNAWVCGYSLKTEVKDVHRMIGYCPQFDALLVDLTPKETLTIFALIRGIPWKYCENMSEALSQELDFQEHLNKRINQLSGGNKRKLSTALCLIGDPAVICLDEPTAGMDPVTKRHLWNAICQMRDTGKCVVLTSHSMEECEALCTKLAIMVNGRFECLGSIQHLKNKFAAGFTINIKIKRLGKEELNAELTKIGIFISGQFPSAVLQEQHQGFLTYYVSDRVGWSQVFGIMERAKDQLNIEDYSLEQASLEQIFLKLTKFQQ